MEEFLAIRLMCSTTTDLPTGGVCVDACMGLLLLPEPQANVATKCTHSPLIQTALAPGTSHMSSHPAPGEGNARSIPHLRKLKILRAPVPHHLRVTNCSLKAKPPASESRGLLVSWHIHGHTTQSHFHTEVAALSEQLWQRPRGPRNQNSVLWPSTEKVCDPHIWEWCCSPSKTQSPEHRKAGESLQSRASAMPNFSWAQICSWATLPYVSLEYTKELVWMR